VALPVLVLGAALLWANSESGRATIARLAGQFVPGLAIEGLEGPLPGALGFARLTMADDKGVWLEVEGARLAWDPRALLRREAHVELLAARRIALHRLPESAPPPEPTPPGPLIPDLPQLPVAIRLDRLAAERIELGEPVLGVATALRAEAAGRLDETGLALRLEAATEDGGTRLDLDAALRPATGRLAATVALRGEAGGPVSRLLGQPDRPLSLDLTLDGPPEAAAIRLTAEAGPGLSARLEGTIRAPDLARLGATLEGRVEAAGILDGPAASLAGPVELALDAQRLPAGPIEIRALGAAGAFGHMEAEGRLDPDGAATALRLRLRAAPSTAFAALLPEGIARWEGIAARAEVTGALAAPRVALELDVAGFGSDTAKLGALLGEAPRLALVAQAPDRIERLDLTGAVLRAELSGAVGERLDARFAATLDAAEGVAPGLAGALRLQGTATGARDDPTLTLRVESEKLEAAGHALESLGLTARIATPFSAPAVQAEAEGRYEGLPLSLALRGAPDSGDWLRLEEAQARFGPVTATASGRIRPAGPLAEGRVEVAAEDLAPLAPLLGQAIAGSLRLAADLDIREGLQGFAAKLEAPRLSLAGTELRGVTVTAEGTPAALDFALSGRHPLAEAEARGKLAALEGGGWRLDLAALRATAQEETVSLAAPARITLTPEGAVEIGSLALALPRRGSLRAEGRWGPETADIRATLAPFDLAALSPLLPDGAPSGSVSGEIRVTGRTTAPEANVTLRGTGLRSGLAASLPPGELRLEARRAGDGATSAQGELRLGTAARLALTARFPRGPGAALPLEGRLEGNADLAALSAPFLAAGADRVTGRLTLNLTASGTLSAPVLGGEARLAGGSYRNAEIGARINDLAGTLRAEGQRLRADITGTTTGNGRIALGGTIEPIAPNLPLDLTLNATQAQPVTSDIIRETVDAELRLSGALGTGATLSGPIRIRRADITIPEQLPASVRTLGPVTERGTPQGRPRQAAPAPAPRREAQPEGAGLPIALALTIEAPRNVFVRGRGVDAELGGQLRVGGTISAPEVSGDLTLRRGEVTVIGRRIAFQRGRLHWTGALLPELDLVAQSQAGNVTARVEITGPPTQPRIAFTSTPELPQDEILARLLFDRPVRDLSPFELAQVAQAIAGAAGLPGGGAAGVLDRLRQGLGLDRLAVGGGTEGAARNSTQQERSGPTLEAGRYIADGVYVGVRQGTEGQARVGVRVDLTPRLRLEAETGDREAGERIGLNWEWQWGR
jgi:translocation and assembly module TamB